MELAGIEPASKDPSIPVSPITVFALTFPLPYVQRQTEGFSSFINRFNPQSLGKNVLRLFDAGSGTQRMMRQPTSCP